MFFEIEKVFSIWKPNFTQPKAEGSDNWCSKDAYMCALIQIYVVYAIFAVFIVFVVVLLFISWIRRALNLHIEESSVQDTVEIE